MRGGEYDSRVLLYSRHGERLTNSGTSGYDNYYLRNVYHYVKNKSAHDIGFLLNIDFCVAYENKKITQKYFQNATFKY